MTKWMPVTLGFLLTLIVKMFFAHYTFIGLLIVGFIVGYYAHSGIVGGLWNAAVAGALGTIISAVLFIFLATVGGSFIGILGGLAGFTISGVSSIFAILEDIIYYAIVMGITGAFGGALSDKKP